MTEHEEHVRDCGHVTQVDPVDGRSRYDLWGQKHVCEHVAQSIAKRDYFAARVVLDPGALDGLQVACIDCEARYERTKKPGPRWSACAACCKALELRHGWSGLDHVAPRIEEAFETWHERVGAALPNVPPEVAREWIHRHWAESPYNWMPLDAMRFAEQEWPLNRVLAIGVGSLNSPDAFERREDPGQWVRDYMEKHRTWSTPIIVLDNQPSFDADFHRHHLLEGHRRLGFLRVLAEAGRAAATHRVWSVRIGRGLE